MDFNGYKEVPIYNDDGTIAYYQLEITWKENNNER
jgi:hypothetical protein